MNIPLTTSGTFAEIRNNHFHSGMDFRVGGEIGEPVYSVSDGYVSRIKVSAFGGGKTVYITHRNGFKSVYMHLNNFSGKIASYVKEYQYTNKVFEFDLDINDSVLLVEHGQQIGNAGNTGGSQGPHLHFELRYAHNDKTINPLLSR
jgi:murein DD-endopeptidase MepM/ murein hydrolase activator NlpD